MLTMQVDNMLLNEALYETGHGTISNPPAQDPNPGDTDVLFAQELNKLSIKERDTMLRDIHGVSDVMEEAPAFVARCFNDFEEALSLVPDMDKSAYLQAKQQNELYVSDEKFVLMFLRADLFDVNNAASRMVAFFQAKLELFGPEKLGRELTLDDLNEDDVRCLNSGYAQVLPGRDRSGRAIFCLLPMIRAHKCIENKLRSIFFLLMHALRDRETQKRGVVGLAYNVGRDHTKDREAVWKNAKLLSALPISFKGVHYCYDDERVRMLFALAMYVFEKNARIRCRLHFGTDLECVYTLMTFGIPSDVLPITPSGEHKLESHFEFVRKLRKRTELHDGIDRIVLPGTYDVLLGRGKPLQKHPGNLSYHHIIEAYKERYDKAMKLEKTMISKHIVQNMKESGGRFLKQDDAGWLEIDDDAARYKVSHTFRNHRIAIRAAKKKALASEEQPQDHRRKHNGSDASESEQISCLKADTPLSAPVDGKRRRLSVGSKTWI